MPDRAAQDDRFARFPLGPGLQAAMRQAGDQPISAEWYPRDASGGEIGVALAFGEQGCYVWSPLAGVRLLPFAAGAAGLTTPPPAQPPLITWETRLAHPDHWDPTPRARTRGIVWHCTAGPGSNEGQYEGTIGWFRTPAASRRPASRSSAHVVVAWDGRRGALCVPLEAQAWHVATPGYNAAWLGVELCRRAPVTAGPAWPDGLWPGLAAWAVVQGRRFGFDPADPASHVTHAQVQPWDRTDPGPWFRLDRILEEIRRLA